MEVTESTAVETSSTQESAPVSASPEVTATASTPESNQAPEVQAAPAYQPNWKYKYLDKEEEFPEWIRPVVKSKEYEDYLRELHTSAKGLPFIKGERDKYREEFQGYKKQTEPIMAEMQAAYKAYERGDLGLAFQHLGVPREVAMKWVLKELQQEDLPPEQKQEKIRLTELERQNIALQEQIQSSQTQYQQTVVQARTQELNQALQSQEVITVQNAYDQAYGPGAFRNFVIAQAQNYSRQTGQDLPASEAVMKAAQVFKAMAPQQQVPAQAVKPQQELPVIPIAKGSGSSPVTRSVEGFSDMKKIYNEKYGQS